MTKKSIDVESRNRRALLLLDELILKWSDLNDPRPWSDIRDPVDELSRLLSGSVRIDKVSNGYVLHVKDPRDPRLGIEHLLETPPTGKHAEADSLAAHIANLNASRPRTNPMRPDQMARVVRMLKGWRAVVAGQASDDANASATVPATADPEGAEIEWIEPKRAAAILDVDQSTVTRNCNNQAYPYIHARKVNGRWQIPLRDIESAKRFKRAGQ